jgi:hypothetical protein
MLFISRFQKSEITLKEYKSKCKAACTGEPAEKLVPKAARQSCEAKAESKGSKLRLYGLLWDSLVSEGSEDLSWTPSVAPVTALAGR